VKSETVQVRSWVIVGVAQAKSIANVKMQRNKQERYTQVVTKKRKNKKGEQMNYKMVRAEDNIVWVTVQPLMTNVKQALENAKNIDTSTMSTDDKRGVDFTILSMEAVYNFLGSLMTEQNINEMVANAKPDITHTGTLH
jgi:hypothetical protein